MRENWRRENLPPPQDRFKVETHGADVVQNWLKLQNEMASNFYGDQEPSKTALRLGIVGIKDSMLTAVGCSIAFDPEEMGYELQTSIVTRQNEDEEDDRNSFAQIFRNSMLIPVRPDRAISPPIDLRSIEMALKQKLGLKGFLLEFNEEDKIVNIKPPERPGTAESDAKFGLHFIPDPRQTGYCFHFNGRTENDLDAFRKKYELFGELTQEVVNSMYRTQKQPAPEKTLVLNPPKNTAAKVEYTEKALKARQRMMSASGVIEEDFSEEINQKVRLERKPETTYDDIGGLEATKRELKSVVKSLKDPESFDKWGTDAAKGVLLVGPSGTGKTMLARATANAADTNFYNVKVADVLNSLWGRTEKLVQAVFKEAKKNKPVIIFFDELDALAGNRDHSTEVTSRIVNIMNTELDGLEERGNGIVVLGATNRPNAIDSSLLRPGRFDMVIDVPLPNDNARRQIINLEMASRQKRAGALLFAATLDIDQIIAETAGFSGADLHEIFRRLLHEKALQEDEGRHPGLATTEEFIERIKSYDPIRKTMRPKENLGFHRNK